MSFFTLKLSEEAKKIEIFPKFQRQMEKTNIFKCKPPEVHFTIRDRVPYNKLLTNLACSSRTVEYWPSVVFVRTERSEVRSATTSGQYSPVRPSRSVSKRLLILSNISKGTAFCHQGVTNCGFRKLNCNELASFRESQFATP